MSRHLERLLSIDQLLRSQSRPTTVSLGQVLEVSERTIRSDLAFMRDRYDAPLAFNKSQGWHYTDPDWRLPTIPLSRGEVFALTLGARMLAGCAGSVYAQELRSAIQRLAERLPEKTWVDLQQLAEDRVTFSTGELVNLNPEVWHQLEDACQGQLQVQMSYYTAGRAQVSERMLDPYLLYVYRGTNPYVIGYCHRRQAIRWFRVDRIQALTVLDSHFERDPNFDAKRHLDEIFQCEVGTDAVEVRIWFDAPTAPYIRERRWHVTQVLEEHSDGAVTLQMRVGGLNDVKRWVLGYGKGAIVLAPPSLVAMVRDEVMLLCQHYGGKEA